MHLWIALLLACGTPESPAPAPEPIAEPASEGPTPEQIADATAKVDAAVAELGGTLKKRLMSAMQADGAAAAVDVCNADAQGLTAEVATKTGITVTRSSLKLRNPKNAPPDWVRTWLEAHEGKPAAEASASNEVVDGSLRAIRPIPLGPPCVACHGPEDALSDDVKAKLDAHYPDDAARGYAAGDLRGAFWAEVALE